MSRTDKDEPDRVRLAHNPYRKVDHAWNCDRDTCDADDDLLHRSNSYPSSRIVGSHFYRVGYTVHTYPRCRWDFPPDAHYTPWFLNGPKKIDRKLYWYSRARAEERAKLSDVAKDYRANGEVDHVEFDHQQHRHSVSWFW